MNDGPRDLRDVIRSRVFTSAEGGARIVNADETTLSQWLFDFRRILLEPRWLDRYAEIFWERYAARYPFQVCGMESAAISLVAAIVMKGAQRGAPVNGVFIRKSRKRQGLMKQIEGTLTGDPIILVDDLINSGKTFDKQIKVLTEAGLRVAEAFALLAFRDMAAYESLGVPVSAVFSVTDFGIPLLSAKSPEFVRDSFEVVWKFQAPDPSYNYVIQKSAPIIDEKNVYFGTDSGVFYGLDQETGEIVWMFKTGKHPEGKGIFSSPALYDGVVYFGAYDGNVYALDAATGDKKWIYDDADWIGSSPALAPDLNLLFIGLEYGLWRKRGGIAALRMDTGKEVWKERTPELTHCSPLYIREENMIVIGSNDATVYAYRADSGEPLWRLAVNGDVKASFAYDAKRRWIFFGTLDGIFYAVGARDGLPVVAKELGAGVYSTPLVDGDTIYISSLDKHIYALNAGTGKEQWSFPTAGRIFASPIIADDSLWCGSNDGRLYEIDPATGALRSSFQVTERIVNKIAYNEKGIYVSTQANEMYRLTRNRGKG